MKRFALLVLALMLALSSTAFAFDPTRFLDVKGITVEYEPETPTVYSVTAGFAAQAKSTSLGGHMLVRYKNAGKTEELPLILVSFTSNAKASHMSVRTDEHTYEVTCTDLAANGLSAIDHEATLLLTADSRDLLADMASSSFVLITIWDDDPAATYSFMLGGESRAILQLFVDEYDQVLSALATEGSTLEHVYNTLTPSVTSADVPTIAFEASQIANAEYETIKNGSTGDDVARLQQALIDMDLLSGKADGIFGNNTGKAISAFQTSVGIEPTGKADPDTQIALYLMQLANAEVVEEEE